MELQCESHVKTGTTSHPKVSEEVRPPGDSHISGTQRLLGRSGWVFGLGTRGLESIVSCLVEFLITKLDCRVLEFRV